MPPRIEQQVVWLYVPVYETELVYRVDRQSRLADIELCALLGQSVLLHE